MAPSPAVKPRPVWLPNVVPVDVVTPAPTEKLTPAPTSASAINGIPPRTDVSTRVDVVTSSPTPTLRPVGRPDPPGRRDHVVAGVGDLVAREVVVAFASRRREEAGPGYARHVWLRNHHVRPARGRHVLVVVGERAHHNADDGPIDHPPALIHIFLGYGDQDELVAADDAPRVRPHERVHLAALELVDQVVDAGLLGDDDRLDV